MEAICATKFPLFTHSYLADCQATPDLVRAVMCLNWAIWKTFYEIRDEGLHQENAPKRIAQLSTSTFTKAENDRDSAKEKFISKNFLLLSQLTPSVSTLMARQSATPAHAALEPFSTSRKEIVLAYSNPSQRGPTTKGKRGP